VAARCDSAHAERREHPFFCWLVGWLFISEARIDFLQQITTYEFSPHRKRFTAKFCFHNQARCVVILKMATVPSCQTSASVNYTVQGSTTKAGTFYNADSLHTGSIWLRIGQVAGSSKCGDEPSGSTKCGEFLE
jgi:hypothetical protein